MSFLSLELGYWIASRDSEVILKIFISRFSVVFPYNLQLIFFPKFFVHFRVKRSSRANEFFSGLADVILGRFQKQQMVLNIFLKYLFLRGKNFALGLKASRVLAMNTFLFSFYSFSFSIFWWFHSCSGWHCSIDLLVWQSRSEFFIQFFELHFRTCTAMFFFKCSVSSVCVVCVCVYVVFVRFVYLLSLHVRCVNMLNICGCVLFVYTLFAWLFCVLFLVCLCDVIECSSSVCLMCLFMCCVCVAVCVVCMCVGFVCLCLFCLLSLMCMSVVIACFVLRVCFVCVYVLFLQVWCACVYLCCVCWVLVCLFC